MNYSRIVFYKTLIPETGQYKLSETQVTPGDVPEIKVSTDLLGNLISGSLIDEQGQDVEWQHIYPGDVFSFAGHPVRVYGFNASDRSVIFTMLELEQS